MLSDSEAQTRANFIDQQLALSGWNVKDPMQVVEEFDILTALPEGVAESRTPYEGHQFSDYVLLGKDRKPLAVVEVKKSSRDAAIGREQAKQYCYNIQKQLSGELPFCFYANGLETYFWDLENAPPRKVVGFPTRDDLERFAYTGIDVREIVNLVFAKPVYSYTKFWQMIGRGTRLLEASKPKPWCTEKDVFLILDCWDNFEYFKLQPRGKELKPQLPLPVRLAGLRLDKIEKALDSAHIDTAEREATKLRQQIAALPKNSVVIKEAAVALARLEEGNFWISLTHHKLEFLLAEIKPLFRTVSEADFKAMRFERDLLEYSLAVLNEDKDQADTLKEGIVEQISELPLSVNRRGSARSGRLVPPAGPRPGPRSGG